MNAKNINQLLWGTKNPTLSEYLTKLAILQLGQEAGAPDIASFVESRSRLLLEDVYLGDTPGFYPQEVTHFRVEWMQVSSANIWLAAEDNERNWWIGIWNPSDKQYHLSPSTCFYSSTPQKTELQTSLGIGDVITGGPIHLHPRSKAPMLAYYRNIDASKSQDTSEGEGTINNSFNFHLAVRVESEWRKCNDLDPIVVSLPTRYKAKSVGGPEQSAAEKL